MLVIDTQHTPQLHHGRIQSDRLVTVFIPYVNLQLYQMEFIVSQYQDKNNKNFKLLKL